MIIETNPCEKCDFCPSVCGVDIELCQIACKPLLMNEDDEIFDEYEQNIIFFKAVSKYQD